jgi:hypothetical protein
LDQDGSNDMEIGEDLKAVGEALQYAVAAGRLRAAIREHGSGLRGLERLADAYSHTAAEKLGEDDWRPALPPHGLELGS